MRSGGARHPAGGAWARWRGLADDGEARELVARVVAAQWDAAAARASLERLLALCRPVAERIARTYVRAEPDASDMVQEALPPGYRRERPCTIALDNYGVHHSAPVKDALPKLAAIGVAFYYLPAYGPELNRIEPEWHALKYHGLQDRSFTIGQALKAAVDAALDERAAEIAHTRPSVLIEVRPPEHHRRRRPTVPDRIAR